MCGNTSCAACNRYCNSSSSAVTVSGSAVDRQVRGTDQREGAERQQKYRTPVTGLGVHAALSQCLAQVAIACEKVAPLGAPDQLRGRDLQLSQRVIHPGTRRIDNRGRLKRTWRVIVRRHRWPPRHFRCRLQRDRGPVSAHRAIRVHTQCYALCLTARRRASSSIASTNRSVNWICAS